MQRSVALWDSEKETVCETTWREKNTTQPSVAPAALLQLSVLSLSLSCTQEIILPHRSPAPQIYYSSPSALSQQDGTGATQRKVKREEKDAGVSQGVSYAAMSACIFTTMPRRSGTQNDKSVGGAGLQCRLTDDASHPSLGVLWLHFQYHRKLSNIIL